MTVPRSPSVNLMHSAASVGADSMSVEPAPATCDPIAAHLRVLSEHIGSRPAGTEKVGEARRYIERAIRGLGGSPETQPFSMVVPRYQHCTLMTDTGRAIRCLPALGSASTPGVLRAIPNPWRDGAPGEAQADHEGGFLLCPIGPSPVGAYTRRASERKTAGVILYHPDVPDLYSEVLPRRDDGVPCVTVRRADAEWLAQEQVPVRLNVACARLKITCANIQVEVGTVGRPVLLLAHYDTRPASPGALCNASGTAVLLELLSRLRGWTGPRILLGFLDGEELSAAGSRHCRDVLHAMGTLKRLRGVIYVSEIGLQSTTALSPQRDSALQRSSVAGQSHLMTVAKQCVVDGKIALSVEAQDPGNTPGIWSCPTIGLAEPPASMRHTSADRPDFIHPEHLSATAAILDRLVRAL
jgi:peptidase M28-like protein